MKKILLLILCIFIITSSYNVLGMGFGGPNPYLTFENGMEEEFIWQLITTSNVVRNYSINVGGYFADYCTITPGIYLENVQPKSNPLIYFTLKIPEDMEDPKPGMHVITINMKELPIQAEINQGIYALTGAMAMVHVNVLYEGKFLEGELNVEDINTGDLIKPLLELNNYGKEKINDIDIEFSLYDTNDNKIKTSNYKDYNLESDESKIINGEINSLDLNGGTYIIKANVSWDGETSNFENEFKIGNMDIEIINHTTKLYENKINEFNLDIESKWNGQITNIYADINFNGQNVKTANINLNAWQKGILSGYINTEGIDKGEYDVNITLHYGNNKKNETFKISIEKVKSNIELNSTIIIISGLVIIVVLLIGINIFILMKKEGKHEKRKKHKK